MDSVGLPLSMAASHDSQNAVSETLRYATAVTWSVHSPICRTWLFQSIWRRSSSFFPVGGVSFATLLPVSSWCSFRESIFQPRWLKCGCLLRSACPFSLSKLNQYLVSGWSAICSTRHFLLSVSRWLCMLCVWVGSVCVRIGGCVCWQVPYSGLYLRAVPRLPYRKSYNSRYIQTASGPHLPFYPADCSESNVAGIWRWWLTQVFILRTAVN